MQQLKYLLKLLPTPEVVGGSCCCSGQEALLLRVSPWAVGKLARKSSFFFSFPYIYFFFLMAEFLLLLHPLTSTVNQGVMGIGDLQPLEPPEASCRRVSNHPVGSRFFSAPPFISP